MISRLLLFLTLGSAFLSATVQAETYTYPQLVKRMTDMQELAKLPPPGEKTSLASSYDRHSQYDAATDKYIDARAMESSAKRATLACYVA
jgi:hypothetical protein